jgi:hypothetical protein
MEHINRFKEEYLRQLAQVGSFKDSWPVFQREIENHLSNPISGQSIFDLGDHLQEIFKANSTEGRGQGSLSGGGAAWECLVSWYVNFVLWNTPTIAVRQNKKFVPKAISDCTTVTIYNNQTNTESDILLFDIPQHKELKGDSLKDIQFHLSTRLQLTTLVVLQCKTNWNDNAQIPMLWDMIYNSESRLSSVSVGVNGYSPKSLRNFKYAFATVPSNTNAVYKPTSVSVLRVKGLTGGNYWGRATTPDVAASIKELASRHFSSLMGGGAIAHIENNLAADADFSRRFLELDFESASDQEELGL